MHRFDSESEFIRKEIKNMKKILKIAALALAAAMLLASFGCVSKDAATDSEYVKNNGKLVIGITDFQPMDYKENGEGEWIGFDADYARAFCEYLGVTAEFIEIDWDTKETELDGKTIDCIWNGMTLTDGVKAAMETSVPYCENAQVVVMKADKIADYATEDSIKALKIAVEAGSAGDEVVTCLGCQSITRLTAQSDALMEVAAGTSDACVIDLLMAKAMTGTGTDYADLTFSLKLNSEEYGVGFRKGSDLAEKLNEFMKQCYADGTAKALADKYGIVLMEIK